MSRENVELVRNLQPSSVDMVAAVREYTPGSAPQFFTQGREHFAEDLDVRFVSTIPEMGEIEGRGIEGLAGAWRDWLDPWSSYVVEVEELIEAGDDVITLVNVTARTARDNVAVEHKPAAVWRIEDGTVVAISFYLDRENALEAAGVAEKRVQSDTA